MRFVLGRVAVSGWDRPAALVAFAVLGVTVSAACGPLPAETVDGGSAPSPQLVEVTAWSSSAPAHDPFAQHRPAEVLCPDAGWQVEGGSLEVSTGACHYLSVEQGLLRDVAAGEPIIVNLWHQALHADYGAIGHAALVVGDGEDAEVLWEREVGIPGPSAIWRDEVRARRDLAAGERVTFHLHNHGANTWNLGSVLVGDET